MVAAVFAGEGLESLRRFPETGREEPAGRVPVMSVLDSIRSIACTVLASQSCELLQMVGHSFGASTQQILLGVVILAVVGTYGRDRPLRDRL